MNVVGETLKITACTDPTKVGISGVVIMDTRNTLTFSTSGKRINVAKAGSTFEVLGVPGLVDGRLLAGRLEERLKSR